MNRILRAISILLVLSLSLGVCVGCTDGGGDDDGLIYRAKSTATVFLDSIAGGNDEVAKTHLHPHFKSTPTEIVSKTLSTLGVRLKSGIKDREFISFHTALYDSEYDGSVCEMTVYCTVDGRECEIDITVVDNDEGYGIYYVKITTERVDE